MKLKIISSTLAMLGTTLILSACVPEVPPVPTVPTLPTTPTTTSVTTTSIPATTAPTTTSPSNSPAPPTQLKLDRVEQLGNSSTYNAFFSWEASTTPGVKYCVGTTSYGSSQANVNCNWSNQYLETSTTTGFGLVFAHNATYQFQVTAIDSNNRKSDTVYLNWQLP